jgi:hypothetical protein
VSWGFHIKSAHRITALEPLMLVLNPWRLALLFLVSGAATRFMLQKYRIGPLLRSRSARLLIPLIFGMLVIVPPQAYDQILESLGYPAGFLDFYTQHYFAFGPQFCRPGPCLLLPTWNHLWFVAYLWVYTMALGVVVVAAPGLVGWIERRLASALSGVLLLVVPSVVFAAYRLVLLPSFPSTHALFGDWYNHALFATVFLIGFLLAHSSAFWQAVERQRWVALVVAVASTVPPSSAICRASSSASGGACAMSAAVNPRELGAALGLRGLLGFFAVGMPDAYAPGSQSASRSRRKGWRPWRTPTSRTCSTRWRISRRSARARRTGSDRSEEPRGSSRTCPNPRITWCGTARSTSASRVGKYWSTMLSSSE